MNANPRVLRIVTLWEFEDGWDGTLSHLRSEGEDQRVGPVDSALEALTTLLPPEPEPVPTLTAHLRSDGRWMWFAIIPGVLADGGSSAKEDPSFATKGEALDAAREQYPTGVAWDRCPGCGTDHTPLNHYDAVTDTYKPGRAD